MIIRSITESTKINEALPTPLSKALKVSSNKSIFQSAAKKLRATLDDNTLSQVEKISNRDKRLKDKNSETLCWRKDGIHQGESGRHDRPQC